MVERCLRLYRSRGQQCLHYHCAGVWRPCQMLTWQSAVTSIQTPYRQLSIPHRRHRHRSQRRDAPHRARYGTLTQGVTLPPGVPRYPTRLPEGRDLGGLHMHCRVT